MRGQIDWPMLDFGAGWVLTEEVIALPVRKRSDGPRSKSATAIGADVV